MNGTRAGAGFLLLLSLWLSPAARALEPDWLFDRIGAEQGLSESLVLAVLRDRRGFVWFGTRDGLNRYDGYGTKVFRPEPGNPQSLSNAYVFALDEDAEGQLWIGTADGLNRYNPETGRFQRYFQLENSVKGSGRDTIHSVLCDDDGGVWVGSEAGLDRFDPISGR